MPEMAEGLFAGQSEFLTTDIVDCEVSNGGKAVKQALRDRGWDGERPVGSVLLQLAPYNIRHLCDKRWGGQGDQVGGDQSVAGSGPRRDHYSADADDGLVQV